MNAFFDRLNLTASERRLVIVFLIVLFVLLNMWFVFPYFDEWETVSNDLESTRRTRKLYQLEIQQVPELESRLAQYQEEAGTNVMDRFAMGERLKFERTIDALAQATGVTITRRSQLSDATSLGGKTNEFFSEINVTINATTREEELIRFLYRLGTGDSAIRVRDLVITPERSETALGVNITLVANYRRESALKTSEPPTTTEANLATP